MSTKRLSKTVIEGGRYGRNKFERRQSHVEVRAQERDYLKAVMADREHYEDYDIDIRQPVYKGFTDKLAPMYRWIEAQVGRPWSEVRSEVFQKFDIRTTAGRHVIFDHLLREVVDTDTGFDNRGHIVDPEIPSEPAGGKYHYRYTADYYVDQEGILRADPEKDKRRMRYREFVTEQDYRDAEAWLGNRMVMEKDGKFYWLMPTQDIWKASWFDPNTFGVNYSRWGAYALRYYVLRSGEYETKRAFYPEWDRYHPHYMTQKTSGDHWEHVENPYSFRQRGQLSPEDTKIFKGFKTKIQNDILSYSMGR